MARMRYIKPEFWTDSKMVKLSLEARLLYIGMWNFAICDKGHIEDDVLRLKMQIFPADNIDVQEALDEIMGAGRVIRFTATTGETYLHAIHLGEHQKVDPRWSPRCAACKDTAAPAETPASPPVHAHTPRTSPKLSRALPNSPQEGIGGEGRGEEGTGEKDSAVPAPGTAVAAPRLDVDRICRHLADRIEGNGSKRPEITKAWRDEARKLLDLDGRTEHQIIGAIDWCQGDDFWRSNVLSMGTLRKKYDQLRLASQRTGRTPDRQADLLRSEMAKAQAADARTAQQQTYPQIGAA